MNSSSKQVADAIGRLHAHAESLALDGEIHQDIGVLEDEIERLQSVASAEMRLREGNFETIERLRAALQWYAKLLGNSKSMDFRLIHQDGGRRALDALGEADIDPESSNG